MVRLISSQRGGLAALKLTKLFGIDDFQAAKNSEKVLVIIIYCYLIIIIVNYIINIIFSFFSFFFYYVNNIGRPSFLFFVIGVKME